jgi:hypothetical protein
MSGDSDSGPTHYLGFGASEISITQVVHECRNVCVPLSYVNVRLIRPSLSGELAESQGTCFPLVRGIPACRTGNGMDSELVPL